MHIVCEQCGSSHLRRSHFRLRFVLSLLFLHYPVRCMNCYQRKSRFLPWTFGLGRTRSSSH